MTKTNFRIVLLLVAVMTTGGCALSDEASEKQSWPAAEELQEGLTVLKLEPGHVMGAYKKLDRVLYFETRRGRPTLDVYRELDPEVGEYEMDGRFVDEEGRTFYIQQGGDFLVEKAWEEAFVEGFMRPPMSLERILENNRLIKEAAEAFAAKVSDSALALDLQVLENARLAAVHELEQPRVTGEAPAGEEPGGGETGYGQPGTNSFHIHGKWLIWLVAEHTADYSNIGGQQRTSCNHGKCASSMDHWCSTTSKSAYAVQYYEYSSSLGSVGTTNCRTSYYWNSKSGYHNCHDDTVRSLWGFKYGSQGSAWGGVCANGATHWLGPGCGTGSW